LEFIPINKAFNHSSNRLVTIYVALRQMMDSGRGYEALVIFDPNSLSNLTKPKRCICFYLIHFKSQINDLAAL